MSFFPGTLWQKGAVLWELNSNKNVGRRWAAEVKNKKRTNTVLEFFSLLPVHHPLQQIEVQNLQNVRGELFTAYFF